MKYVLKIGEVYRVFEMITSLHRCRHEREMRQYWNK